MIETTTETTVTIRCDTDNCQAKIEYTTSKPAPARKAKNNAAYHNWLMRKPRGPGQLMSYYCPDCKRVMLEGV